MTAEPWTIAELSDQVADALSDKAPVRADGRVREVPDPRTIRWYQTTGLVDRPSMRGRTALYGERHLLQLLAIKHLQGRGEPLSQIQAQLAGASDDTLARLAGVAPRRRRSGPTVDVSHARPSARPRFWAGGGGHQVGEPQEAAAGAASDSGADTTEPVSASESSKTRDGAGETRPPVASFRLDDGVILVVDGAWHRPTRDDTARLRTAAQPLLDTLEELGLLPEPERQRYQPDPPHPLDPGASSPRRPPFTKEQA